jgi:hypothetical protein
LIAYDNSALVFGTGDKNAKYPFMIECPFEGPPPTSVSLVENKCDHAENNLKLIDIQPADGIKKRFGVCSKKARFENRNFAIRFIEWVHMVRLLGAEKVHFSYDYVHPDMFEIINYFEEKGMLETWQYLNPTGIEDSKLSSWQGFQIEVVAQTDCFYKVMNLYDYVALIDMDELIIPVMEEDLTWEDLINRANSNSNSSDYFDGYVAQNVFYPESKAIHNDIPKFMYILQNTQRSKNYSVEGEGVKTIVGTERILTLHTHYPHHCLTNKRHKCHRFWYPTNMSQNSHYRDAVDPQFKETQDDTLIWKYKDKLIKAVQETLKESGFVP